MTPRPFLLAAVLALAACSDDPAPRIEPAPTLGTVHVEVVPEAAPTTTVATTTTTVAPTTTLPLPPHDEATPCPQDPDEIAAGELPHPPPCD